MLVNPPNLPYQIESAIKERNGRLVSLRINTFSKLAHVWVSGGNCYTLTYLGDSHVIEITIVELRAFGSFEVKTLKSRHLLDLKTAETT